MTFRARPGSDRRDSTIAREDLPCRRSPLASGSTPRPRKPPSSTSRCSADAKILEVTHYGEAGPRPAGTVMTVSFMLEGQEYMALNGGPEFPFTEAVSFSVSCEDQEEVDRLWARLLEGGGVESQCGWLKDRFGLSWQIIPDRAAEAAERPGPGAGPARDGGDAADDQDRRRGPGEGGRRGLTGEQPQVRRASSRRPVRNARSASLSARASASSYADRRLGAAAQPAQQVGPGRRQVPVARQPAVGGQPVHLGERGLRAGDLGQRDRPVERDDRRRPLAQQRVVERDDPAPPGLRVRRGDARAPRRWPPAGRTGRPGCGAGRGPGPSPSSTCARSQRSAVLVGEQHQPAGVVHPGVPAGVGEQHQGEQAADLRLVGHQRVQHPAEVQGPVDQVGAHQVGPRSAPCARS